MNNAGAMIPNMEGKRGIDIPDEELRAVMDNNLFTCSSDNGQSRLPNCSMVSLTRLAVPHLETTKGAIVNVSSIAAQPHLSKVRENLKMNLVFAINNQTMSSGFLLQHFKGSSRSTDNSTRWESHPQRD